MLKEVYSSDEATPALDVILFLVTVLDYLVADILQVGVALTTVVNICLERLLPTLFQRLLSTSVSIARRKLCQQP
jgi:hypothetical protein